MTRLFRSTLLFSLLFSGFNFSATAQESEPAPEKTQKIVVIPIREQIAKPELFILRRGLKQAITEKADLVILDMETPGGRLDVTFDMLKALDRFPGKTVTYINSEAISAGAIISTVTDEIWFAPSGIIGAAAPITGGGEDINETMKLKIVSYLKAKVRAMSGEDTNRAAAISAMIDSDYVLQFGDEVIKPKGELLSLTAIEATKEYGDPKRPLLAAGIATDLEDLMKKLSGESAYEATILKVTWSEKLAQYITMIAPLLMALGLVLIIVEFKTPGFGIFGIAGGILMVIFFFGHTSAGLSGNEAAILFFIGFALVIIDLFFIPGFFVLAVPGGLLMLGTLLWGMSDIWPDESIVWNSGFLLTPMMNLTIGIAGAIAILALLVRFLPSGGPWGGMVLESAIGGQETLSSIARKEPSLLGKTGHAVTALFPSGEVKIAGKRYDARLEVGTLDAGAEIKVISVGEFDLRVESI